MRFLILGCNGMAGHMLSIYLREQGHDVVGFAREASNYVKTVIGDATNFQLLQQTILNGNFDFVVNCIGILNQFAEKNHAQAVLLNAYLPHFIAKITEMEKTRLIHISTDCVFSGKTGNYKEDSFRDGETFYDRSKALGEIDDKKNVTLRCSIVGPDINASGIGLLNWFLQQSGEIDGYTQAFWTGQTTLQLAKTVEATAKMAPYGIHNAVPMEKISKYELLQLFNQYLRNDRVIINQVVGHRLDKSLTRTRSDFNYLIPCYEKMIKDLATWMNNHCQMYPHYKCL